MLRATCRFHLGSMKWLCQAFSNCSVIETNKRRVNGRWSWRCFFGQAIHRHIWRGISARPPPLPMATGPTLLSSCVANWGGRGVCSLCDSPMHSQWSKTVQEMFLLGRWSIDWSLAHSTSNRQRQTRYTNEGVWRADKHSFNLWTTRALCQQEIHRERSRVALTDWRHRLDSSHFSLIFSFGLFQLPVDVFRPHPQVDRCPVCVLWPLCDKAS